MTLIVGIDPSLTSTGVAVIDTSDVLDVHTATITSAPSGPSPLERLTRISGLVDGVIAAAGPALDINTTAPRRVVIEAPAYSSRSGSQHDRSGLWWVLVDFARASGALLLEVPPTTRAKYAAGRGNAGKDEVLLAVERRYPHVGIAGNDQADALALAAIGARLAGCPIEPHDPPKSHLDALSRLDVPKGWAS